MWNVLDDMQKFAVICRVGGAYWSGGSAYDFTFKTLIEQAVCAPYISFYWICPELLTL